jgi:polyhydroxybutyrate depolymerase
MIRRAFRKYTPSPVAGLLAVAACGSSSPVERPHTFGGADRPVDIQVPASFADDGTRYPLVLLLHGYAVTAVVQEAFIGVHGLVEQDKAFVIAPDGLLDSKKNEFWNADPACCDFDHTSPDDVAYLSQLVDDVAAAWPVDRNAIQIIGYAAGGFMAYRLACERADTFAAIAVVAAAASLDPNACKPSRPVSVLHMHGTADTEFPYAGGGMFGMTPGSPGAVDSVARWGGFDGCAPTHQHPAALDLDASVAGTETQPDVYGCADPVGVELWTMTGSSHLPNMTSTFVPNVWPWLERHHR